MKTILDEEKLKEAAKEKAYLCDSDFIDGAHYAAEQLEKKLQTLTDESEKKLLQLFGFSKDNAVLVDQQLKIFEFIEWLKTEVEHQKKRRNRNGNTMYFNRQRAY